MIERVISGGQTGADQAGWRAARAVGIATGGWMPKGYLTEDGPRPEFAELYGAQEHTSPRYPFRTEANVWDAHVTLWFGDPASPGGRATSRVAAGFGRHFVVIGEHPPYWLSLHMNIHQEWKVVNVAGNRESKAPGIGAWVERYLTEVFRLIRDGSPA
jgi:hypothetical protein